MKLNFAATTSAFSYAAFATLTATAKVSAFSPALTPSGRQMMGRHLNHHDNNVRVYTSNRLLASNVPIMPLNEKKKTDSYDEQEKSVVVAEAVAKGFIPSPNGFSGVMTVKLREEDFNAVAAEATPKVEGDEKLLSQTGMFGGNLNKGDKSKKTSDDYVGKTVSFSNGKSGTIIAQRPPIAFVLCDFAEWDESKISVDRESESTNAEIISILNTRTSIPVGDHLFGNIVDCYGHNIDMSPPMDDVVDRAIFAPIPQIKDIALINSPLLTGTAMVDALAPIGKGQNMLVIGQDSGVGQRDILIGAIKTQIRKMENVDNNKRVKCVYALTTQDQDLRQEVLQMLENNNLLDDIVVVVARDHGENLESNDKNFGVLQSAEATTVAAAACSIAEAIALSKGEDTFVVVDNIDLYKSFWDWTTRVLVDIYGVDAVVKDDINGGASSEMRGFYSSLIQRAGRFNDKNGSGSVTLTLLTSLDGQFGYDEEEETTVFSPDDFAESSEKIKERIAILVDKGISLTSTTLRKIQIPLPDAAESEQKRRLTLQHVDDLISMSDGQIWFDELLYSKGQRPAIDPQRSITRVGIGADTPCRADAPALRNLIGGLRFDFAQAASLDGAGANSGADRQILKRDAYLLALHQDTSEVRLLSENCVALLAVLLGLLDKTIQEGGKAGTELGRQRMEDLIKHAWQTSPTLMKEIDDTLDIIPSARSELESTINEFFHLDE